MDEDCDNLFETDMSNPKESSQVVNTCNNLINNGNRLVVKSPDQPPPRRQALLSNQRTRSCYPTFFSSEIDDVISLAFVRACLAELFGTLLLCFYHISLTLHRTGTEPPGLFQVSFGTGIFVTVLVSSLAHISGCLVNPAVTLAFAVLGHIGVLRACVFTCFQLLGAVAGSWILKEVIHPDMVGKFGVPSPAMDITDQQAVLMETIVTSVLVFVNVSVVDKKRTDVQGPVPVIVGLTVVVNTLVGGPFTGACMNPARAFGPAFVMGHFNKHWIFWVGPCCGGLIGALLYDKLFSVTTTSIKRDCAQESGHSIEEKED